MTGKRAGLQASIHLTRAETGSPWSLDIRLTRSNANNVCLFHRGFVVVVGLIVAIVVGIFTFNNLDFQRGYCNGYTKSNANNICPFHPASP